MKSLLPELELERRSLERRLKLLETMFDVLDSVEFGESAHANPAGGSCYIYVYNREDLRAALSIADEGQHWTKSNDGDAIRYSLTIEETDFDIFAKDTALPPTCKVVEEEYLIPAEPARIGKRCVVKCNEPPSPAVAAPSDTGDETTSSL